MSQPRQLAHTTVSVANTSTEIVAANTNRTYLLLVNDSDEDIYIKIGAAAVQGAGIRINSGGGSFEMSGRNGNLDTRVINGICATGTKDMLATQA